MQNKVWQTRGSMIKRLDIVIVLILIILSVLPLFLIRERYGDEVDRTAEIYVDGRLYQKYELDPDLDEEIEIKNGDRINVIRIEGERIWMEAANCFNEDCVRQGAIEEPGRSIVCLPNNVYIVIIGEEGGEVDDIAR